MSRLTPAGHRAGLLGGALGVLAAGAAVGLAAERYAVGRTRLRPDPEAGEAFGELPGRSRTVPAADGLPLHVEEAGDPHGAVTVVFVHGYANDSSLWHYQRRDLADAGRLVFFDQRGHGRSARPEPGSCTLDQLGADLGAVLDAVCPAGPAILVGHSMGGMAVMALAEQRPELFGDRVIGVGLLSTSAGRLAELTFGLPTGLGQLGRAALPALTRGVQWQPALAERSRRLGTDLGYLLTRRYSFGSTAVSPSLVHLVEASIARTPAEVIAAFYPSFVAHDKVAALAALAELPTLVLAGERDRLTPVRHSRDIAAELPTAELAILAQAGHMVILEQPALVNDQLRALLRRSGRWAASGRITQPAGRAPSRSRSANAPRRR